MKAFLKKHTTDKYLKPIRNQVNSLVPLNVSVLELACGTGQQLFDLSSKVSKAKGIDVSKTYIEYAKKKAINSAFSHIEFERRDVLTSSFSEEENYDYGIVSLFFI